MRLHYAGKYTDESQFTRKPDPEGFVQFREPENMKRFALLMNVLSGVLAVLLLISVSIRSGGGSFSLVGILLAFVCLIPHEFLHAVWFREDVYLYTNLKQGMLFVYGSEDMSKARFVILSLCPNIVFGLIPYIIFMVEPTLTVLGTFGAASLSMGAGDYLNVFNCLTQVPKGAVVYANGMHTYWYKK